MHTMGNRPADPCDRLRPQLSIHQANVLAPHTVETVMWHTVFDTAEHPQSCQGYPQVLERLCFSCGLPVDILHFFHSSESCSLQ